MKKFQGKFHITMQIAMATLLTGFLLSSRMAAQAGQGDMYAVATDLTLSSQNIASAAAGRDIALEHSQVMGRLSAGRNLNCTDCNISGEVAAGRDISLEDCAQVRSVNSGRDASLRKTTVQMEVSSGRNIQLEDAHVGQQVSAGNQLDIRNSTIQGELSLGGPYASLDRSTVNDIRFTGQNIAYQGMGGIQINSIQGNGIQSSGNSIYVGNYSGRHVNINTGNMVYSSMGSNGISSINGYMIKSSPNQTTLITPGQTIYVNARKVSGEGPHTYAEYRRSHPEAPRVNAPGWPESQSDASPGSNSDTSSKEVMNVLELSNNSVVNGQVVFENGYGMVKLHPGSILKGKVINGTVEKQL